MKPTTMKIAASLSSSLEPNLPDLQRRMSRQTIQTMTPSKNAATTVLSTKRVV